MKRLAMGLVALLSGCIFVTPPTGLRIGDHSQEFANLAQQTAVDPAKVDYETYEGPDFTATYPKGWAIGTKSDDMTTPTTTRVAAGQRFSEHEAEGLIVTTFNTVKNLDDPEANQNWAGVAKQLLAQGTASFTVVEEKVDTFGGEKAMRLEIKFADANKVENHEVVYTTIHAGRAWLVLASTLESRFTAVLPVYNKMLADFKFKPVDAAASPVPSGSPTASASPVAGSPQPGVSPAASVGPSASPPPSVAPSTPPSTQP